MNSSEPSFNKTTWGIGCMASFLTDRTVDMVLEGNMMESHPVESGIPQGSLVSPILFAIYRLALIKWVEERVAGTEGLSFVDDVGWVAMWNDVNQVSRNLEACARVTIDWTERWELEFDTAKTKVALFTCRRCHKKHLHPKLTVKIRVGNGFVRFNREVTRWLGVWMDTHLTFKEYHNRCIKKVKSADVQLQSLTGEHGILPPCMRAVQVACVQAITLYKSEVWWDPKEGSRRDDLQLLLNRKARSTLRPLLTTLTGTLMRDSRLTLAVVAIDARQQLCVSRLASPCEGWKWKELYHYSTPGAPVGRVAAIEHARGRTAETMCWADPGENPAVESIILEDNAATKKASKL